MIVRSPSLKDTAGFPAAGLSSRHLHSFLIVVRRGTMRAAADELGVAPANISVRIAALERSIGAKLFDRVNRKSLRLTETGRLVADYAEEFFSLGQELLQALRVGTGPDPVTLRVGVETGLSQRLVTRLLAPWVGADGDPLVRLDCRRGPSPVLLAELTGSGLDLVLTAEPPTGSRRLVAHRLGDCGLSFLAAPGLADDLASNFPASLNGAPVWLPAPGTVRRRALDTWFAIRKIEPQPCGACDDEALLELLAGGDVRVVPTAVEADLCRAGLAVVGRADAVRESVYAIAPRRHSPFLAALLHSARQVFGT